MYFRAGVRSSTVDLLSVHPDNPASVTQLTHANAMLGIEYFMCPRQWKYRQEKKDEGIFRFNEYSSVPYSCIPDNITGCGLYDK